MAVEPTRLVWSPHPLLPAAERSLHAQEPRNGENLRDYLHRGPVDLSLPLKVWLDDREIPREDWSSTPVHPGQIVTAHALARGGDGSDPVATILTIAVLVAAPQFAPNVNAALGLAADSAIGGALITVGGMYLVSQLNRPPEPLNDETDPSPSYSLSGGGNRARQHQPLPLVIGTHRIYPDLGAQPFTELRGPDQYLMQVFNFGLSDLTLSDYKIGDTLLSSYSDYRIEESDASGALTLFPGNVDSLGGADLTLGTWVQLTSSQNCNRLAVDISGLLFYAGNEGLEQLRATLQLEYRPVGDTTWNSLTGSVDHRETVDNGSRDPVRLSYSNFAPLVASPNGQYEVRVQFVSLQRRKVVTTWVPYDDTTGTGGYSEQTVTYETISISNNRVTAQFHWDQLKSYQPDTADYSGQKRVALEIRATAQLNGAVSALNAIASARCEVWNGSAWVTQATSNPAWWFRWFALGKTDANGRRLFGGGYTDADLDLDRIKAWGAWCDSKGLAVNLVLDQPRNCYDLLSMIARCGRASLSWGSGRLGVVYDQANQPAVAVFGMSNIVRDSFRIDYISGNLPDEIVLNWINPALGYRPDTVRQALPGVTNPQNPVTVDLPGITSELQAGREANLIAAEQQYRVRSISWETDLEGLAVSRGDVVTLSHDLTQWGYSGRLISGTTTTLVLDRKVPFTDGQQHYIGLRAPDGSYAVHEVNAQTGESDTLTLTTALPSAPDDDPDNPPIDYLWCFEPKATPGKRVKITDIRPVSEHRVRLIATDEDDAYYLAENDSYSYVTPSNNLPGLPTLGNLTIQTNLLRSGKGFTAEITLAWDADGEYGGAFIRAGYNDEPLSDRGRTLDRSFRFLAPTDGKISVEVTGFNQRGQFGPDSRLSGELIYNARNTAPDGPTALSVAILPDGTRQLLPQVTALPADYQGCLYRARAGSWTTWDELSENNGGLHLHDEPVADIPWETVQIPQGQYTIGVKVVDLYGNESENPALAVVTLPAQPSSVTKTSELIDDANLSGLRHLLAGEPQREAEDNLSILVENDQNATGWYKVASCRLNHPYSGWTFNGLFEWGYVQKRYDFQARVSMAVRTGSTTSANDYEQLQASSPNQSQFADMLRLYRVDNGDGTFTWTLYTRLLGYRECRLRGVFAVGGTPVSESWYDEYLSHSDSLGASYTPPGTQIAATFNYDPGADVTADSDFVNVTYPADQADLQDQIDGKVESWFQSSDPKSAWTTTAERNQHDKDIWWKSTTKELYRYKASNNSWERIEDKKAIDAYDAASTAQATADGKAVVFTAQPTPPYDVGDLWDAGGTPRVLKRCVTARASGSFNSADWLTVANSVTATSQLTDDSGFSITTDVSFILDPTFADQVAGRLDSWDSNASYALGYGDNGGAGARIYGTGAIHDAYFKRFIPCRNGAVYFVQCRVFVSSDFDGTAGIGSTVYDADKGGLGYYPTLNIPTDVRNSWFDFSGFISVSHADANYIRFRMTVRADATTGYVAFDNILIGLSVNAANLKSDAVTVRNGYTLTNVGASYPGKVVFFNSSATPQAEITEATWLRCAVTMTGLLRDTDSFGNEFDGQLFIRLATDVPNSYKYRYFDFRLPPGGRIPVSFSITDEVYYDPDFNPGSSIQVGGEVLLSGQAFKFDSLDVDILLMSS